MRWRGWPLGWMGLAGAAVVVVLLAGYLVAGPAIGQPSALPDQNPGTTTTQPGSEGGDQEPSEPDTLNVLNLHAPTDAVMQNGELSLSIDGLAPGESGIVAAALDDSGEPREIATVQADGQGKVDQKLTLPEWLTSGTHTLQVIGQDSGKRAEATIYVRAEKPWLNPSTYSVQPTQKLGFIAGGFEPEEEVGIYLEPGQTVPDRPSTQPLQSVKADRAGNLLWIEVVVPQVKESSVNLILRGSQSDLQIGSTLTVEPLHPLLELSPWSGPPGSPVDLNGRGFTPGEKVSVYVSGSDQPVLSFQADEYGNFWGVGPLDIPQNLTQGKVDIRLQGEESGASVTQQFSVVAPHPWAELNTYSGPSGTPVLLSGGGFAAKERVSIHVGNAGSPAVAEGLTDSSGRLWSAGPAVVPEGSEGSVTFVLVGESSGAQASVEFEVTDLFPQGEPTR